MVKRRVRKRRRNRMDATQFHPLWTQGRQSGSSICHSCLVPIQLLSDKPLLVKIRRDDVPRIVLCERLLLLVHPTFERQTGSNSFAASADPN
jgi:hypothetical protein